MYVPSPKFGHLLAYMTYYKRIGQQFNDAISFLTIEIFAQDP